MKIVTTKIMTEEWNFDLYFFQDILADHIEGDFKFKAH